MGSNLSVAAPGHTLGHTVVRVSSADNELLIWGDIVHNAALQFPEPDRTPPGRLRCELAAVGYREISLDRLTGSDAYLANFVPPSVASRTRPEAMVACKPP